MSISPKIRLTTTLLALAIVGGASAQQPAFPTERTAPATCSDFKWDRDMAREHPRMIDACQEVVEAGGEYWARFSASFVEIQGDGKVMFRVNDQRDRFVEEVLVQPMPGQVAYINNVETPFSRLRASDSLNLYAAEGRYGFATRPGVAREQVAPVTVVRRAPQPAQLETAPRPEVQIARAEPRATRLPTTAGPLPWIAFAGLLSLAGGLGARLRRRG
jgi:hypothetical protein